MRFAKFVLAVVAVGFTQQGCKDTTTAAPTIKSADAVVAETTHTTTITTTNVVPHDKVENVVDTTKVVVKNNEQEDTTKVVVRDNEQEDTRNVIAENSLEKKFKPMFDDVLKELVAGGDEVILTKDQLNSMRIKDEASKLAAEMGKQWSKKAEEREEVRLAKHRAALMKQLESMIDRRDRLANRLNRRKEHGKNKKNANEKRIKRIQLLDAQIKAMQSQIEREAPVTTLKITDEPVTASESTLLARKAKLEAFLAEARLVTPATPDDQLLKQEYEGQLATVQYKLAAIHETTQAAM